ncbi:HXXEE domain-containing protein [Streptomyces alanosinicus]|uniref:Membrane protein n=1 Tax=Streptomyces alanosinicus TaxID=68171 RepID=A0A919D513_9ACTN|nr:HXXEE domain-containing protein [Streptomyces alanosinicus]GHE07958.1 membrane protein [Streptomyces alanosinicus]
MTQEANDVDAVVVWGLLAAWALHDTEEVVMVPRWVRTHVPELRRRFPQVPETVWRRLESVDAREFTTAVAAMAVLLAAVCADGQRTGGRSAVYQTALNAFGLHGLVHLAQAATMRGYTPGSATTPLVVLPFTVWARGRLRRSGVLRRTRPRDLAQGLGFAAVAAVATHALAQGPLRRR